MTVVLLKVNGRDYHVACDDGQEEQLRVLADDIDERVRALAFRMSPHPSEAMLLLLVNLTQADELIEARKEIHHLKNELVKLSRKAGDDKRSAQQDKESEMEAAMALTLESIALRIEKMAEHLENA